MAITFRNAVAAASFSRVRLSQVTAGVQAGEDDNRYAERRCYCPWKKSLIAAAAVSLAVSGASPQAVSIVRSRL
jgi:hypothetical protein